VVEYLPSGHPLHDKDDACDDADDTAVADGNVAVTTASL
jgi:hypothetical protein